MEFERFFVFIAILPAITYFLVYCGKQGRIDLVDPKFQFLFGWFFYGFAVPIDFVAGFEIIRPWATVDYSQERYFNSMLLAIGLFYTVLFGFLLSYRKKPPQGQIKTSPNLEFLTLPFIIIVPAIFVYFVINIDEILTLSRMDRNLQLENTSYRLQRFLETVLTATGCIFILYNKNIKNVHILTIVLILLGAVQGDRSSLVIPVFAWLLRTRPTIKSHHFLFVGIGGILFLFIWKALYSFILAYALGKDVTLADIMQTFSLSIIDPVGPFNLTTWVLTDWEIGDIYGGYTVFVLPIIRAFPRFLFEFDAPTLAEQFMILYLPHIAAAGGGRGFGIIAEFYLNFYLFGPFIFGVMWGLFSRLLNNHHSLILSFLFLMCNFRIFRSDIASVFKSYIIIYGSIFFAWYIISLIIKYGMSNAKEKNHNEYSQHS